MERFARARSQAAPPLPPLLPRLDPEGLQAVFLGRFGEDACQARGTGAWVLAGLWAFLVFKLHREGVREKKAALEIFSFNPLSALRFLGFYASWGSMQYSGHVWENRPILAQVATSSGIVVLWGRSQRV